MTRCCPALLNAQAGVAVVSALLLTSFLRAQESDFTEGQLVPPRPAGSEDPDRGPRPDWGYIGLQNHAGAEVDFKEVSLEPLSK